MNKTRKWIEAGKVLSHDPTTEVPCPVCESAILVVEDIQNPSNEAEFERYIRCPLCGAYNAVRMRVQPEE